MKAITALKHRQSFIAGWKAGNARLALACCGALVLSLLFAAGAQAQARSGPRGIYLYPSPSTSAGQREQAMGVPGVDGLAIVLDWSAIETAPKTYDFSALDQQVKSAQAHKLAIELVIPAGKGVPEWVFARPPAGPGAQRLALAFSHHGGAGRCQNLSVPPYWDKRFQAAFADMLTAVAAHLRDIRAEGDVAVVKLTGMNAISEELRLPAENTGQTQGCSPPVDDVQVWQAAGYRPALLRQAMAGLANSFAAAFPGKSITLSVIPFGAFPPIDDSGNVLKPGRARAMTAALLASLVQAAARQIPGRFILQHDFLIAGKPALAPIVELATANNLPVAWQTNLWLGGKGQGAACGGAFGAGTPCDDAQYLALLQTGIRPEGASGPGVQARYIEVFPYDALAHPASILEAHNELVRVPAGSPARSQ